MGFRDGLYWPKGMREAPILDPEARPEGIARRHALLINPFYPKDPHASFGKHVLTPTLALTSIAGATPAELDACAYWDENLLQGPPPCEPFPQVVGHHGAPDVRARAPTSWRAGIASAGAKVVLGGLHVLSCPDEVRAARRRARASAKACSSGRGSCATSRRGTLQPRLPRRATATPYRDDPPPRRDLLPRDALPDHDSLIATRGCHNRCGFCYLATDGLHMPYQMRDVRAGRRPSSRADGQPYAVFIDNNLGSRPRLPARAVPGAAAAREDLERGGHDRRHRRPVAGARDGAGRLHGRVRRLRVAAPTTTSPTRARRARAPDDYARRVAHPARPRHPGERQLRARLRPRPARTSSSARSSGSRRTGWSARRSTS